MMKPSRQAGTPASIFILSVVTVAAVLLSSSAMAGVLSQETRKKIVEAVLQKGFWGHARLSDGSLAQPASEAERTASPLTPQQSDRAIDVGELTAIGSWCTVDWKPFYLAYTKSLRDEGLSETQVAFAGVLHGVSQSSVLKTLHPDRKCGDQLREATKQRLQPPRAAGAEAATTSS